MWTHQSAIRLSTSNTFKHGWVMLCHVGLRSPVRKNVKSCQLLQTQNSWRLKSVFVFRFSDKLINSIQLHSTPLKHHDTNYSIDPVPPASKGGHDSPESPWKKTNSDVAMETVPGWSMNWCWQKSAETSRNYGFYMDFTMKHRGLLQIFPSDQKNDEPVER